MSLIRKLFGPDVAAPADATKLVPLEGQAYSSRRSYIRPEKRKGPHIKIVRPKSGKELTQESC